MTAPEPAPEQEKDVLADTGHAPRTLAAYRAAWSAWSAWAEAEAVQALPAEAEAVAAWLTRRAEVDGCRLSTLRVALAAVAAVHRAEGYESPCDDDEVQAAMRGLTRSAAEAGTAAPRRLGALTADALEAIRATAYEPRRGPRGRVESGLAAVVRGLQDIAMCQVMADAGLRRSEAAALTWADVQAEADGTGRLNVGGKAVVVTRQAMQAMQEMKKTLPFPTMASDTRVFGLSASQIYRRLKAAAFHAGLGDGYGAHSARIGMAKRMASAKAPLAAVMRQGRWSSPRMVAAYAGGDESAAALTFLE